MQAMQEHHAQEGLLFSIEDGEIEAFLEEMNLRMIDVLDSEAIERKYLLDEDGNLIGRIAGSFRFARAGVRRN